MGVSFSWVSSFYGLVPLLVFANVFMSPIDNHLSFSLPGKGNAAVTLTISS
jgi:hypothetical protein